MKMEIIANALQTVEMQGNVLFTDTVISGKCSTTHRDGSGLVTLRGVTNQCRARYKVSFGANIGLPTGGTVEPISVAIAIEGEAVASTTMIYTPAAVEEFGNVFSAIFIEVPRGCCVTISVKNTSGQEIDVQNANLIVERVA
jgi:hypothetical protein